MKAENVFRGLPVIYNGIQSIVLEKSLNTVKIQMMVDDRTITKTVRYHEIFPE